MNDNYHVVKAAIKYIDEHRAAQPNLNQISEHLSLSPSHLQRVFTEWAGVSPSQWLQFLTKEYAKKQLLRNTVFDSALAAGLSGPGRLYDLLVSWEAVTPGQFKSGGKGLLIEYGITHSPFGETIIAWTEKGICQLIFSDEITRGKTPEKLETEWPQAKIVENSEKAKLISRQIFDKQLESKKPLKILLKGTKFQHIVWEALLKIPFGNVCSYQSIAEQINKPTSSRAVASAIAKNNIAYLIPCHRVIRSSGEFHQYRWGPERKKALLSWEAAKSLPPYNP